MFGILDDLVKQGKIRYYGVSVECIAEAEKVIEYPNIQSVMIIINKETNRFIGRCGLLPWTIDQLPEVEVAYMLAKEYWGQGLGTEAAQAILEYGFEQLRLPRLICLIDRANLASIKVAKKIGMTFEKEGRDEKGPFLLYSIKKVSAPRAA